MNKVYSVNIGGMVFTIDDQAYEKLNTYIASIKRHFSNTEGSSEIIGDIEYRIAEMLKERLQPGKEAISMEDVDYIISAMGKPEYFEGTEETEAPKTAGAGSYEEQTYTSGRRRLFRDPDNKILGGVCSGISAYFNIDEPLWIRLAFVLVFFTFGSGLLLYIILWIVIPKARTITDRMEMRGQDVTINNIKKNMKEEYDDVKSSFNDLRDSARRQRYSGSGVHRFADFMRDLLHFVATSLAKIIAWVMIIAGTCFLIALIFGMLGFWNSYTDFPRFISATNHYTLTIIGLALVIGIPILALVVKSIQLLFNFRMRSRALSMILLGFWITGIAISMYVGMHFFGQFSSKSVSRRDFTLAHIPSDTLMLSLNDKAKTGYSNMDFGIIKDDDEEFVMSNENKFLIKHVSLKIERSSDSLFHLNEIISSHGRSANDARKNAENTEYNYSQSGNKLSLDEYCAFPKNEAWRNQKVRLVLEVPQGKTIYFGKNMHDFLNDVPNVSDTYDEDMLGHYWKMGADGLECPNFKGDEDIHTHSHKHRLHLHINSHDKDDDESYSENIKVSAN